MIFERRSQLTPWLENNKRSPFVRPTFHRILMARPDHFRVEYAINPYMKTPNGKLQEVNTCEAIVQWESLKKTYEKIGYTVDTIEGHANLPDLVFTANQSFPFFDTRANQKSVILSRMRSAKRNSEVNIIRKWYQQQEYQIYELRNSKGSFEGNGDALFHPELPLIIGGFGPRTQPEIYDELSKRFNFDIYRLKLKSEFFYHLDTCLCILNAETAGVVRSAFEESAIEVFWELFPKLFFIDEEEAIRGFAGNAHCPNGKDVIVNTGCPQFVSELKARGFQIHEVDTSEFLKSGGSVFCLKMMAY